MFDFQVIMSQKTTIVIDNGNRYFFPRRLTAHDITAFISRDSSVFRFLEDLNRRPDYASAVQEYYETRGNEKLPQDS